MVNNLNDRFSNTIKNSKRSVIRELLKLTQRKELISFAGGLPSPESFPVEELKDIVAEVLNTDGTMALQYGETEGDLRLRKALIDRYKSEGVQMELGNLIITTASQQGLDLLAKIFINPGDKVICGLPSYLGGLSAFRSYGANLVGVPLDEYGLRSDLLEKMLAEMKAKNDLPKFIYIIPDFQNPAGITMPEWRRKEILEIAYKYDVLIAEDSPYREIRFEGTPQPMFYQLDNKGYVITLGTFSKTFAPGFRIGWVMANEEIIDKFVVAKQATDLCTSAFVQKIAATYIEKGYFDKNIQKTVAMYKEKRDAMLSSLEKYMPKEVKWTTPEGGLFLFVTLPEWMDSEKLFMRAIEKNVAFVMGNAFYCDGSGRNTIRLNFSFMSVENNIEGIRRLADAVKEEMAVKA
ncbi:MAG TPA: PLP-dependent aminotransferase family protein [Bacteroidales bacterium]|jgi:2-aminoadipate transaminase|nr:PLP-dependent aminotransferase family protein [Bacteroidales bacterium]